MEKHFHKIPIYFRFIADFEADNEIDKSNRNNKTTNFYKQNPVLNGYYLISELDDFLESGCYIFPSGYNNVDWYVNEVIKLEKKKLSILKKLINIS